MKNDTFCPSPTIILCFFSDLRRCGDGAMFFQKFTIFLVFMMSTLLAYGRFEPGDLVSQRKKWSAAAGVSSARFSWLRVMGWRCLRLRLVGISRQTSAARRGITEPTPVRG